MTTFATIPQLADYLKTGYWAYANYDGNQPRHWASHTISVNITGLTAAEQNLAVNALELWHEVADVSFTFTSGTADITYNHNGGATQYVANTSDTTPVSGQNYTHETIDISSYWFANDGGAQDGRTGIYSYNFQTYLHETGHALGLGHQGPYNNSATYGVDNIYSNDTWQWSIMSYFSQNNYGGASYDYVISPQMADIYAIQSIYGATTTRSGATTYGFHNNAGPIYDFNNYAGMGTPAFTIYDSGGSDTLDCSGYWSNQTIDLNPGHWSSVGGYVNNIGIYLTTSIENAVGGHGNDLIIPNGSLVGTLTGGGGNDTFQGTMFGLSAYTITDMNVGDKLNFTNAALGTFSHTQIGTSLTYTGGYSLTLSNNPIGHLIETPDPTYGGVDLKLAVADPHLHDFNGDDRSDLLFRNDNGVVGLWEMNGGTPILQAGLGLVGTDWHIQTTGDFDGNNASDILWRHDNGTTTLWQMIGTSVVATANLGLVGNDWHFAETGDFNGDGKNDILWRHDNGTVGLWEMNGGTPILQANLGLVGNDWHLAETSDFNGDGKSDLLWRNDNGAVGLWEMNGASPILQAGLGVVGNDWHIAGLADFDGNNTSDILWRNDNGATGLWFMNGASVTGFANLGVVGNDWHVADTADVNDDGKADILWRNDNGATGVWEMSGGSVLAFANLGVVSNDWHIVA
jgi:serralysin